MNKIKAIDLSVLKERRRIKLSHLQNSNSDDLLVNRIW